MCAAAAAAAAAAAPPCISDAMCSVGAPAWRLLRSYCGHIAAILRPNSGAAVARGPLCACQSKCTFGPVVAATRTAAAPARAIAARLFEECNPCGPPT